MVFCNVLQLISLKVLLPVVNQSNFRLFCYHGSQSKDLCEAQVKSLYVTNLGVICNEIL